MKVQPPQSMPQSDNESISDVPSEASVNRISVRRGAFLNAIPPGLAQRAENLQTTVAAMNAAPRSKLRTINNVLDELAKVATPHVACKRGCSSCCHMNITISQVEANEIALKGSRRLKKLEQHVRHDLGEFLGVPCPFLLDHQCSIYETRPFVCRGHYSFDTTPHWCHPDRSTKVSVPMIHFDGIDRAYGCVLNKVRSNVMADIRDFFPATDV